MSTRAFFALTVFALASGCSTTEKSATKTRTLASGEPKVVYRDRVVVKEIELQNSVRNQLKALLSKDCHDEAPVEISYDEAKRLSGLRKDSLAECNGRIHKARGLLK